LKIQLSSEQQLHKVWQLNSLTELKQQISVVLNVLISTPLHTMNLQQVSRPEAALRGGAGNREPAEHIGSSSSTFPRGPSELLLPPAVARGNPESHLAFASRSTEGCHGQFLPAKSLSLTAEGLGKGEEP